MTQKSSSRGNWASRLGFILAAAGSAIGLGNIWKFPYITGQNGGGAFVLVYLACIALIGLPIMMAEFLIGRHAQRDAVGAFEVLEGRKSPWCLVGWTAVLASFVLFSFYAVVAGWGFAYVVKSLGSGFAGQTPEQINALFGQLVSNPVQVIFLQASFLATTSLIVLGVVRGGIERWSKILMPVLFLLLTTLLALLVIIYGQVRPFPPQGLFLAVVFAVEAALVSSVVTVDLMWFVVVTALQLLPVSYLLHKWSTSAAKDEAVARFVQFMGSGVLLLFAGALMLGWQYADAHGGQWSFDLYELAKQPVEPSWQSAIFFLLFYGMAVRIPIFPLHGWLPRIAEHGSVAVAPVFLIGLKTGIYGLFRFVLPLLPEAVMQWHSYVVAFAVAGVFYAALLALTQVNLRRLLAFAVISHPGILMIVRFRRSHLAFQGTMSLSVTVVLAAAG